jgi:acetoin:2,6-dichlorophenolindophenol oxidoreductase subunit alpha
MLLIRRFEEAVGKLVTAKEIIGGHPACTGQEASAVGTISQLKTDDFVLSTHRNTAHLLAKGLDPAKVMAEIVGRATGYNGGKGGSYHVSSPELGVPTTSAIVGANVALAGGLSFAQKSLGSNRVTVCMIGDSVPEEGVFYESVNIASLLSLPVVYVCENNSGSITTPTLKVDQITDTVKPFGIPAVAVDGSSVEEVHSATKVAIERARAGNGPSLVETRMRVIFMREGTRSQTPSFETDLTSAWNESATPAEFRSWSQNDDGLIKLTRKLVNSGAMTREEIMRTDEQIKSEIERCVKFVLDSPWPKPEGALEGVFPTSSIREEMNSVRGSL